MLNKSMTGFFQAYQINDWFFPGLPNQWLVFSNPTKSLTGFFQAYQINDWFFMCDLLSIWSHMKNQSLIW